MPPMIQQVSRQKGSQPGWGTQDFADLFDITPRAVRFYEDKGLLTPSREAGIRVFYQADYDRMDRILRAKRMGFTLDDIKVVMDVTDGLVTDREELLSRKSNFEKVIRSLKRRREDIDIMATEMSELCEMIDNHVATTPPGASVFKYAQAYDASLREYMDDEFGFEDSGESASDEPDSDNDNPKNLRKPQDVKG